MTFIKKRLIRGISLVKKKKGKGRRHVIKRSNGLKVTF